MTHFRGANEAASGVDRKKNKRRGKEKEENPMKKTLIGAAIVAAVAFTQTANAQSASAPFAAKARIVTPISIAWVSDMNFGDVVAGAGTVVLTPAGGRSVTGGTNLGNPLGVSAATFTVSGQANSTYSIGFPPAATIASGANTMNVGTFTSTPTPTGLLSAGGTQTLNLGATLTVAAAQATGSYTGNFNVSVNYN
jgi:Domain of unknown function (DUF4402)